ncbi:MAG TPA: DUF1844 domain-containing protein [Polyangia bacterium]|nr:DUF1844 domain-containing protein [Polyangia bacterium]
MGDSDAKGGFKVTDRRSFAEGGEPRPPEEPAAPPPAAGAGPAPAGGTPNLPAVDFHTFVLSLGSSALLHLGELEHPDVGAPQKDLPLAKHTIDILVMLEEKTKGNLTPAEEKLIASLLYDLRLRYVEAQKTS